MRQVTPRVLRADERGVIVSLCSLNGVSRPDEIALDALRVFGRCECGCASIDFGADAAGGGPYAEGYGVTATGIAVGLILWERDNQLSGLEVYMLGEETSDLPLPELLHRGESASPSQ